VNQSPPRRRRRKKKKTVWPVVLAAALLLAALAATVVFLLGSISGDSRVTALAVTATPVPVSSAASEPVVTATPAPAVPLTPRPVLEIDPNAGALITPTPAPQEPGVAIPGWGSMSIPAGVTEVATAMKNPEANEGWYYLTFELRLKDTGEVLFKTGFIPPGQYCNAVTLTRPLEPGEYAAIVHVQPYRIADQSPTNNADMETVLIVK